MDADVSGPGAPIQLPRTERERDHASVHTRILPCGFAWQNAAMRSVLGIGAALVIMSAVTFALSSLPWFALGIDAVLQPGRFDTVPAYDLYAVAAGIVGAAMGALVCARVARSRNAVIALAAMAFLGGAANAIAQSNKKEPGRREPGVAFTQAIQIRKEPAWFAWLMPCAGAAVVVLAGLPALKTTARA